MEPYSIYDVSAWTLVEVEPAGDSGAIWIQGPDELTWLFKPRKEYNFGPGADDVAERITTAVARLLGVPVAEAHLALREGQPGTVSRNVVSPGWDLQPGSVLLAARDSAFVTKAPNRAGHHLEGIYDALDPFLAPPGHGHLTSAFEAFTGYLLLDALVANVDRHEQNWAVLRSTTTVAEDRLSPSWDHGSALGHNLTEGGCATHSQDVRAWAEQGRARRFDHANDGQLTLVQLAAKALAMVGEPARTRWWAALASLTERSLDATVEAAGLSEPRRRFMQQLLVINRRRLLDERDRSS